MEGGNVAEAAGLEEGTSEGEGLPVEQTEGEDEKVLVVHADSIVGPGMIVEVSDCAAGEGEGVREAAKERDPPAWEAEGDADSICERDPVELLEGEAEVLGERDALGLCEGEEDIVMGVGVPEILGLALAALGVAVPTVAEEEGVVLLEPLGERDMLVLEVPAPIAPSRLGVRVWLDQAEREPEEETLGHVEAVDVAQFVLLL